MATFWEDRCSANVAQNVAGKSPAQRAKNAARYIVTLFLAQKNFGVDRVPNQFESPFGVNVTRKTVYGQNKCSDVAVSLNTSIMAQNAATFTATFRRAKCSTPRTLGFIRKRNVTPLVCWGFILLGGGMNEPV